MRLSAYVDRLEALGWAFPDAARIVYMLLKEGGAYAVAEFVREIEAGYVEALQP